MTLQLLHGRLDPSIDMNETGFRGPRVKHLDALCVAYNSIHRLVFTDRSECAEAKKQTGWDSWDDLTLELRFDGDMVRIDVEGGPQWFGDWHLENF